jgi:hypothetical protein
MARKFERGTKFALVGPHEIDAVVCLKSTLRFGPNQNRQLFFVVENTFSMIEADTEAPAPKVR